MTPFVTVVADPPWRYANAFRKSRGAAAHYETMTVEEIIATGIPYETTDRGHLYLWVTNAFMEAGHDVCRAWGYEPKTILTWVKPAIGMGHYYRNNTEHVIFGVRGNLKTLRRDMPTWFLAPRQRHSQKPEVFYRGVETASPGPFLEMYARAVRPGWTAWGLEAPPAA